MQYLLSKEELDNLVPKSDKEKREKALELARKRILKLSEFNCSYDNRGCYCDNCPCLASDEEAKEYEFKVGSRHDLYDLHSLICNLPKHYSK